MFIENTIFPLPQIEVLSIKLYNLLGPSILGKTGYNRVSEKLKTIWDVYLKKNMIIISTKTEDMRIKHITFH